MDNLGDSPHWCDWLPTLDFNQKTCVYCDAATITCPNHHWAEEEDHWCYACFLDQKPTYTVSLALEIGPGDDTIHFTARNSLSSRVIHSATYVDEVLGVEILNDLLITILSQSEGKG